MTEGIVGVFLHKLSEMLVNKAGMFAEVKDDVELLRNKLQWIRLSLREADNQCPEDDNVKLWVSQVRDAAFKAEDIIDEFVLSFHQNSIHQAATKISIADEIRKINSRLDSISENRSRFGITNVQDDARSSKRTKFGLASTFVRKEKRAPTVEEADVVGVEDEAMVVSKMLIEGGDRRSVVSIVGMGGLGKTTLAKKLLNDDKIRRHFNCFAWIYVSQEFAVRDLLCEMMKWVSSHNISELRSLSEDELEEKLYSCLEGRRYLIVIDDIWNREAWDSIKASFPNENNGSRIMLTTRKKHVALQADPISKPYELRFLRNEESWELLHKKAFPEVVNHIDLAELEKIGKEIAIKCRGLPLAVVVLGGLLSTKQQLVHEWRKVLKAIDWHLNEGNDEIIFRILALSYKDLPCYLKSCFLHVAAFPEDARIPATKLLRMWVAEEFVEKRGDETLEEVAEDYLLELIHRSLIQVEERSYNGRVKKCGIHDLLRDLAIRKAKENQFLDVYSGNAHSASPTTARKISITHHDFCGHISLNHSAKHLHSLLCFIQFGEIIENAAWKSLYARFKLLRVLHIELQISMLPNEIGDLIHLRYLFVKFVKNLPTTLSNLYNLHTLIIINDPRFSLPIPNDIWKMRQLRHLHVTNGSFSQKSKHVILNELTHLQSFKTIEIDYWIKSDFDKLTSLRSLGLRGNLMKYQTALSNFIDKIENVESLSFSRGEYDGPLPTLIFPSHLCQLKKLSLWGRLEKLPALDNVAHCLTKLVLARSNLLEDPMAVLEKLPKLQLLKLLAYSYLGKKMCCSANGFPVLAVLEIQGCSGLEDWIVEEGAIANLRRLKIFYCPKLKMLPKGLQHVTTLKELVLAGQPAAFRERVQENGLDWFKFQHVPSVRRS